MYNDKLPCFDEINKAWEYIETKLYNPITNLLYDRTITDINDFPTAEECQRSWPNPCGYGTNMDDCMINAGTMLSACVGRYDAFKEEHIYDFANRIVEGMIGCGKAAETEGFLPRGISPIDKKSHYIDSSRDQYTMFLYGAHRYINSPLCEDVNKRGLAEIIVGMAKRAEKNVVPETGFDLLRDDEGKTLNNVMWGPDLGNHEMCRLPMIYITAWEYSGDAHWLDLYKGIREEAITRSLPMKGYGQLYTMQQMQASLKVCYDLEPEKEWREKYLPVMKAVAEYVTNKVKILMPKLSGRDDYSSPYIPFRELPLKKQDRGPEFEFLIPEHSDSETFWLLQDAAIVLIVSKMMPDYIITDEALEFYRESFAKIDINKFTRALPIHFMDAYFSVL